MTLVTARDEMKDALRRAESAHGHHRNAITARQNELKQMEGELPALADRADLLKRSLAALNKAIEGGAS